jgi:hypothetical protein
MNQRDQELLDKQLWGVSARPPGNRGLFGFAALAVFCAGLAVGSLLFKQPANHPQTSWRAIAAISSPNAVPPALLR